MTYNLLTIASFRVGVPSILFKPGNMVIFFEILKFILSRDDPGQRVLFRDICSCPCPRTKGRRDRQNFFVPGQRDNGTGKLFCPGTKGQRDVLSRFVPGRPAGRPVPWKPYYSTEYCSSFFSKLKIESKNEQHRHKGGIIS